MGVTEEQRAALLANAEAVVARLTALFAVHRAMLENLGDLPFAASGIHPKSTAVRSPDIRACHLAMMTEHCVLRSTERLPLASLLVEHR